MTSAKTSSCSWPLIRLTSAASSVMTFRVGSRRTWWQAIYESRLRKACLAASILTWQTARLGLASMKGLTRELTTKVVHPWRTWTISSYLGFSPCVNTTPVLDLEGLGEQFVEFGGNQRLLTSRRGLQKIVDRARHGAVPHGDIVVAGQEAAIARQVLPVREIHHLGYRMQRRVAQLVGDIQDQFERAFGIETNGDNSHEEDLIVWAERADLKGRDVPAFIPLKQ